MVTAPTPTKASAKKAARLSASAKKSQQQTPKVEQPKQKPAPEPEKKQPEPTELDPNTFVRQEKLVESLKVVRSLQEQYEKGLTEKKPLFDADMKMVHLQVELKKIPANYSTFIHSIPLPRHWRHQLDQDTCLIVSDVNKAPLTDRDLDLEQTKGKYFDALEAASANDLVKDILPTRQLRNEFRPKALRQKLASEYGAFLCDRKLLRNKHAFLARFLGKAFWLDHKRVPVPVDLEVKASELRPQIEAALNLTHLYVSGKGSSLSVAIGSLDQSPAHLLANLQEILRKVNSLFTDNIRSLTVKTEKSLAVTFYMDLGTENRVRISYPGDGKDGAEQKEKQFVEDEFDFLTSSAVRVYRDGNIRIVPSQEGKKRKLEDDEDAEEEKQSKVKKEEAAPGERKLIRAINRSYNKGDHDWVRHKVAHLRKATRANLKRLPGGAKSRRGPKRTPGQKKAAGATKGRFFSKQKTEAVATSVPDSALD